MILSAASEEAALLFHEEPNAPRCHQKTGKICDQGGGDGIPCFLNAKRTEINADCVEGSFGGSKHYGGSPADQRVRPILHHKVGSDCQCCAAAYGAYQKQDHSFLRNTRK